MTLHNPELGTAHRSLPLLCVLLLVATGCWSTQIGTALEPVAPDVPSDRSNAVPGVEPEAATIDFGPASPEPSYRPASTAQELLPGGVIGIAHTPQNRPGSGLETSLIRVAFPVAAADQRTAHAWLTAHAVAEIAAVEQGRPSLRNRIESLGGTVRVHNHARRTAIDVLVPLSAWEQGLQALLEAVAVPPRPGAGLERLRTQLANNLRAQLGTRSVVQLAQTTLGGVLERTEQLIAGVEDLAITDLVNYHETAFRPTGAVLALWVPGSNNAAVFDAARRRLPTWTREDGATTLEPAPKPVPPDPGAALWAKADGERSQVALLIARPHPGQPQAAEVLTLLECLTADGIGGRLGAALRTATDRDIALRSTDLIDGTRGYLLLTTDTAPQQTGVLWRAYREAWASLLRSPPRGVELRRAADRVRLRLIADYASATEWVELMTGMVLSGIAPFDLGDVLARLENPTTLGLDGAAAAVKARSDSLLVVGSTSPAKQDIEPLTARELAHPFALTSSDAAVPSAEQSQIDAAGPYLDRALQAMGGKVELGALRGMAFVAMRESSQGARSTERSWFRHPNRLRIVRRVLATTIETVIGPGKRRIESVGTKIIELDLDDAWLTLTESTRHPLTLLSGYARGMLQFRLVSVRGVGDRAMAVLELVGNSRGRLRIAIDSESGLVRTVESLEFRPELRTSVEVVDTYSDYRSVDGLRVPYYRVSVVDGGSNAVSTTWTEIRLATPTDAQLEPRGPTTLDGR